MRLKEEIEGRPPRAEKVETVQALARRLEESKGTLLADYRGMTVKAMGELRALLRARGASCQVIKNTMLRRAAAEAGCQDLLEWLVGPTAAVFLEDDIVGPAKALLEFVRANANLPVIKGGVIEGRRMAAERIKELAELPPREVLLATLVGSLRSPLSQLLATLGAPLSSLVATLQGLAAKGEN